MSRHYKPRPRPFTFGEPPVGFEPSEPPDVNAHLAERSCADCAAYAPISTMITMADSRMICKMCWRGLRKRSVIKAQPSMLETDAQLTLF